MHIRRIEAYFISESQTHKSTVFWWLPEFFNSCYHSNGCKILIVKRILHPWCFLPSVCQKCQHFQQLLCCSRLVYYSWWNNALIEKKNTSYLQMTKCVATKWDHCGSFLVNDNASCQKDAQISPLRLEMIQGKLYLRHWQPWQCLCWFYGCFGNHSAVCVRGCLRIQTYYITQCELFVTIKQCKSPWVSN